MDAWICSVYIISPYNWFDDLWYLYQAIGSRWMLFAFVMLKQDLPVCLQLDSYLPSTLSFPAELPDLLEKRRIWTQKPKVISWLTRFYKIMVVMRGLLHTGGNRWQKHSHQDVLAPQDTLGAETYWSLINGNQPQAGSLIELNWVAGKTAWRLLLRRWLFPFWLARTK